MRIERPVVPERLLPKWAKLYGVKHSVMLDYCSGLGSCDKLPRGLDGKCSKLRPLILNVIKGVESDILYNFRSPLFSQENP